MVSATSSTVPGSVTGSGNTQADSVDPYGPWGIDQALAGGGTGSVDATLNVGTVHGATLVPYQVQPAGTTDTLAPYQDLFIGATYGTSPAVREVVWSTGYNPWCIPVPGEWGMYSSFHADAGDTNISGAHGIEWVLGFQTPAGPAVNPIEVVGVRDNTCALNVTLRHGVAASDGAFASFIAFGNADGSVTYQIMKPASGTTFQTAVTVEPVTGNSLFTAASVDGNAVFTLNSGPSGFSEITFVTGTTPQWAWANNAGFLGLSDLAHSSRTFTYYRPGATSAASSSEFYSRLQCDSSLIVGFAALATTATDGHFYAPSCAGAPTGVPAAHTGTVPVVVDSTDSKLYAYIGGSWKSVTLA